MNDNSEHRFVVFQALKEGCRVLKDGWLLWPYNKRTMIRLKKRHMHHQYCLSTMLMLKDLGDIVGAGCCFCRISCCYHAVCPRGAGNVQCLAEIQRCVHCAEFIVFFMFSEQLSILLDYAHRAHLLMLSELCW